MPLAISSSDRNSGCNVSRAIGRVPTGYLEIDTPKDLEHQILCRQSTCPASEMEPHLRVNSILQGARGLSSTVTDRERRSMARVKRLPRAAAGMLTSHQRALAPSAYPGGRHGWALFHCTLVRMA